MKIKYAGVSMSDVETTLSGVLQDGGQFKFRKILNKLGVSRIAFIVTVAVDIVSALTYLGSLESAEQHYGVVGTFCIGLFFLYCVSSLCIIGVFGVASLLTNSDWYKEFETWLYLVDVADCVQKVCETQKFLQEHRLKTVRVTDNKCEFEVYCKEHVHDITMIYTDDSIPRSSLNKLVKTGVLDFTCIDDAVQGIKCIREKQYK